MYTEAADVDGTLGRGHSPRCSRALCLVTAQRSGSWPSCLPAGPGQHAAPLLLAALGAVGWRRRGCPGCVHPPPSVARQGVREGVVQRRGPTGSVAAEAAVPSSRLQNTQQPRCCAASSTHLLICQPPLLQHLSGWRAVGRSCCLNAPQERRRPVCCWVAGRCCWAAWPLLLRAVWCRPRGVISLLWHGRVCCCWAGGRQRRQLQGLGQAQRLLVRIGRCRWWRGSW